MKFKTKRTSETGKKFCEVEVNAEQCLLEAKKLAKVLGVKKWRPDRFAVFGGLEEVFFDSIPDKKLWRLNKNGSGYYPNRKTKVGKQIYAELKALPLISYQDLNDCISFNGHRFRHIGVNFSHLNYIGFTGQEDWDIIIPDDCEEITVKEYNKLFKS
ncbi:MAG: hypothetical protein ACFB15_25850 [Cyclobacteriaceae bacterium]